jgi:hypothetical protein
MSTGPIFFQYSAEYPVFVSQEQNNDDKSFLQSLNTGSEQQCFVNIHHDGYDDDTFHSSDLFGGIYTSDN